MPKLWRLGDLTFLTLLRRVGYAVLDDDVFGQSAKLSYYFLLALFPLLLLLTTLFGFFAESMELRSALLEYFRRVVPGSAFRLVQNTLDQITEGASAGKLSIGVIGTLFAASGGLRAIMQGLNTAYGVTEGRPLWKHYLLSIIFTVALTVFVLLALLLILIGPKTASFLARYVGFQHAFQTIWSIARWPVAFFIALLAINLLYLFAPGLKKRHLGWFTPGAIVAVLLWLSISFGFRIYLRHFNTYNKAYGSLGAVIVLLLWFYFTGAAILIGAEVNSEIESSLARSGIRRSPVH